MFEAGRSCGRLLVNAVKQTSQIVMESELILMVVV
jgi:hypothetical protein